MIWWLERSDGLKLVQDYHHYEKIEINLLATSRCIVNDNIFRDLDNDSVRMTEEYVMNKVRQYNLPLEIMR